MSWSNFKEQSLPRFTFRQLAYLVAVGDTGSIARSSETLNVSCPSKSHRAWDGLILRHDDDFW